MRALGVFAASVAFGAMLSVAQAAEKDLAPETCLPRVGGICVWDAKGEFVGVLINRYATPTVARIINGKIYAVDVNADPPPLGGIQRDEASFYYASTDCSGTVYMQERPPFPTSTFADNNGALWAPTGAPQTVNVQSICIPTATRPDCTKPFSVSVGACQAFPQPHAVVGTATLIDSTLATKLTAPFTVTPPP